MGFASFGVFPLLRLFATVLAVFDVFAEAVFDVFAEADEAVFAFGVGLDLAAFFLLALGAATFLAGFLTGFFTAFFLANLGAFFLVDFLSVFFAV